MRVPLNNLTGLGLIKDIEPTLLLPHAWTTAENVRMRDGSVQRIDGNTQIFGTPLDAPLFLMQAQNEAQHWWLYAGATTINVYDGTNHTDISGASAPYAAATAADWFGTTISGIPILTEGNAAPQAWTAFDVGTPVSDLANWPANTSCKVIRTFGNFLMALFITKPGGVYPHMVKWSHPAVPGAVPPTWDETDPTADAGEFDLPDVDAGVIVDGLPLGAQFFVYKENSTHVMRFIGGNDIFSRVPFLEKSGMLTGHCGTSFGKNKGHFIVTDEDVIAHDGVSEPVHIVDRRMRRTIFNAIDETNKIGCFVVEAPTQNEVLFFWPESGETTPNRALIWNWRSGDVQDLGVLTEREGAFVAGAVIDLEADGITWESEAVLTWESDNAQWNESSRRQVAVCDFVNSKILQLDEGNTFDGTTITAVLQRESLGVIGVARNGTPVQDFSRQRVVHRVWIRATGEAFQVRLGTQAILNGPITWTSYETFDPASDRWVDIICEGISHSIEFNGFTGKIMGYDLEVVDIGEF